LENRLCQTTTTKKTAAEDGADTKKAAGAEKAKEAKAKKLPPMSVAKGKAITSKKGILGEDEEMKAEYLSGGEDALKVLLKSGHVVKNK